MIHLNEYRGLRDGYAVKVQKAFARRFRSKNPAVWDKLISDSKILPLGGIETLKLYAPSFHDMTEWAAVTRFVWLCELVWEMECDELAERNYGLYVQNFQAA